MVQLPGLIGTVIGPTIGSYLTAAKGWRWSFWLAAIICGVFETTFVLAYRVRILQKRVNTLRKETGTPSLRSKYDTGRSKKAVFAKAILRPLHMLVFSPIVWLMGSYVAIVYGPLFLILTTVREVFRDGSGLSLDAVGVVHIDIDGRHPFSAAQH